MNNFFIPGVTEMNPQNMCPKVYVVICFKLFLICISAFRYLDISNSGKKIINKKYYFLLKCYLFRKRLFLRILLFYVYQKI